MKNCLETQLSSPAGSRRRKDGRVLPGGVGTVPTQQGKEPATSLPTSSIFRDSLVSVLCWRLWPGPEQPGGGDLLQVGMCGDGQYTVRMHATERRAGTTLSPLSSWHSLPLPLKWRKDHTQWVGHSRVPWDPGNKGALSVTPTEIKPQHCPFPSSATWSKSLSPAMLQLPPLQTGIVAVPPS